MKSKLILKIFLFILIITGSICCNQNKSGIVYSEPVFPIDKKVKLEMVLVDPIMPNVLLDIEFFKGKLVLMYQMDNRFVHLYDAETGEKLSSALRYGQGPGEIIGAINFWLNRDTETLSVFDIISRKFFSGNIDSLFNGINLSLLNDDFGKAIQVFPLQQGHLTFEIPNVENQKKRYFMKKQDGEVLEYEGYPYTDFDLIRKISLSYKMGFSKDETKMVAATSPGLILEIFDIINGIKKTQTRYFREILFDNDGHPSFTKSGAGITDFYCSDKYIYATFGEPEPYSNTNSRYNNIAVFDWEGNPLKIFRTNYRRLYKICLDDEERFLYILGEDEEWNRFIAKLDLTKW